MCVSFHKVAHLPSSTKFGITMLHTGMLLWIILAVPLATRGDIELRRDTVISWADELGTRLFNLSKAYSGSSDLEQKYAENSHAVNIEVVEGLNLVRSMAVQMEAMLQDKAKAVERIVDSAENGFLNHIYVNDTEYSYYNGVLVNSEPEEDPDPDASIRKELSVTPDTHFNDIPVNTSISTVQVPTNVYNQAQELLNSIEATEILDQTFLENYQHDPTLTWQYFGSKTGYFRVYPGYKWPLNENNLDLYDCRVRGWYVEGATSPKDVVILVDMSGSMTGLFVEIAKHLIKKILDTFGDNDFVNVLSFNEETLFIQPCFNDTMVQATSDNKNLIKDALAPLTPYGMADLKRAVRHAFELLNAFNSTDRGSGCNQAIMIISDMLTETAEEEFKELNPNQTVRVFTYQTGREVEGPTNLIKVACMNRGYYTRLATISDVEEQVTTYLHVLSRPMVNKRLRKTVWSSVYWDALGLNLTTTVSQPVFNTRNETVDKGILEGVAGCDVPIVELKKFTPPYKLGVNGYSFAVTNNGYVLFHPELRPLYNDGELKPNFNSVDLSEVELSDVEDVLRDSMVNRLTGIYPMDVKRMFDDMRRISVRQNTYYFTLLLDTPYSLGIALPDAYGLTRLQAPAMFDTDSATNESSADVCKIQEAARLLFGDGTEGQTLIANWLYCKINYSSSERYEGEEHVARFLQDAARHGGKLSSTCDTAMVNHLIFDANVTRFMPAYWKLVLGENSASPIGTTMFTPIPTNDTQANIQDILAQIDEYCSPTLDFTTAPSYNESSGGIFEEAMTMSTGGPAMADPDFSTHASESPPARYTSSTPPSSTEDVPYAEFPYLDSVRDGVVLAFLGTYGGLTRIYHNPSLPSMFGNDISDLGLFNTLEEDYFTRAVEEIDDGFIYSVPFDSGVDDFDYLVTASTAIRLTDNGETFVAAAAGYQFLGSALKDLLFNISLGNEENCGNDCTPSCFNDSVECFLLDNHGYIVASKEQEQAGTPFGLHYQNIRLFNKLLDKEVFREIHVADYQGMCARENNLSAAPSLHNTLAYFTSLMSWFTNYIIVFLSHVSVYDWLVSSVLQADAQALIEEPYRYEPCDLKNTFYLANKTNLGEQGLHGSFQADCDDCVKSFSVQAVPHSNLMLVVQDRDCDCTPYDTVQLETEEIVYNDTAWCERLLQFKTRRRPDTCFNYDPNEDSSECGRGFITRPTLLLLLTSLLISAVWNLRVTSPAGDLFTN